MDERVAMTRSSACWHICVYVGLYTLITILASLPNDANDLGIIGNDDANDLGIKLLCKRSSPSWHHCPCQKRRACFGIPSKEARVMVVCLYKEVMVLSLYNDECHGALSLSRVMVLSIKTRV